MAVGRGPLRAGLLVLGFALVGWGVGNAADNIVSHAHGQDWTVSAGGSLAGLGLALVLTSLLLRRPSVSWWAYVLATLGSILAGYSLGGGIDNLLSEIDLQGHHFAPAMALCGVGIGLAAAAFALSAPNRMGQHADSQRCSPADQ